ncbi:uncharacterized protein L203_100823 [Cryptococcus depauperatus CBS 7841]|uniref:Uncharacterized protein n=1 Tax=Cryptococcus depauperatus CBS 7841 TaxID=1295531 RepID=A0AAJ8JNU9_9TREE
MQAASPNIDSRTKALQSIRAAAEARSNRYTVAHQQLASASTDNDSKVNRLLDFTSGQIYLPDLNGRKMSSNTPRWISQSLFFLEEMEIREASVFNDFNPWNVGTVPIADTIDMVYPWAENKKQLNLASKSCSHAEFDVQSVMCASKRCSGRLDYPNRQYNTLLQANSVRTYNPLLVVPQIGTYTNQLLSTQMKSPHYPKYSCQSQQLNTHVMISPDQEFPQPQNIIPSSPQTELDDDTFFLESPSSISNACTWIEFDPFKTNKPRLARTISLKWRWKAGKKVMTSMKEEAARIGQELQQMVIED